MKTRTPPNARPTARNSSGEYRDKRTSEAFGHADAYDQGPSAHGFQSPVRAERSARRHDRQASYACDAWSKAAYWQQRTAGVIAHALYVSTPSVRMGRIKDLAALLRPDAIVDATGEFGLRICRLRLAYDKPMLEGTKAARGICGDSGGFIGNHQVHKVNSPTATARVVSVAVKQRTHGLDIYGNPKDGLNEFRLADQ